MQIIKVVHESELPNGIPSVETNIANLDSSEFVDKYFNTITEAAQAAQERERTQKLSQGQSMSFSQKFLALSIATLKGLGEGFAQAAMDAPIGDLAKPQKQYLELRPSVRMELMKLEEDLKFRAERERHLVCSTVACLMESISTGSGRIKYLSLAEARKNFFRTPNLAVGSYTYHPRDDKMLSRLANFHKNLAMEKDDELVMLLGRMGAKSVEIIEMSSSGSSGFVDPSAEIASTKGGASARFRVSDEKKQHLRVKFNGGASEIPEDLLSSSIWFSDDSKLNSIFQSRQFSANPIKNYTLENTYSDAFDFDFDFAAKFLKLEIDLESEYQKLCNKKRVFKVEFW